MPNVMGRCLATFVFLRSGFFDAPDCLLMERAHQFAGEIRDLFSYRLGLFVCISSFLI